MLGPAPTRCGARSSRAAPPRPLRSVSAPRARSRPAAARAGPPQLLEPARSVYRLSREMPPRQARAAAGLAGAGRRGGLALILLVPCPVSAASNTVPKFPPPSLRPITKSVPFHLVSRNCRAPRAAQRAPAARARIARARLGKDLVDWRDEVDVEEPEQHARRRQHLPPQRAPTPRQRAVPPPLPDSTPPIKTVEVRVPPRARSPQRGGAAGRWGRRGRT